MHEIGIVLRNIAFTQSSSMICTCCHEIAHLVSQLVACRVATIYNQKNNNLTKYFLDARCVQIRNIYIYLTFFKTPIYGYIVDLLTIWLGGWAVSGM